MANKRRNNLDGMYTALPQSRRLVELGLKPSTADMHHFNISENGDYCTALCYDRSDAKWHEKYGGDYIPCWSGANLFGLLPTEVYDMDCYHALEVTRGDSEHLESGTYFISYCDLVTFAGGTFTEAAFKAMEWILTKTKKRKCGRMLQDAGISVNVLTTKDY